MIAIRNLGLHGHEVMCDKCGLRERYTLILNALAEYREHACPERP